MNGLGHTAPWLECEWFGLYSTESIKIQQILLLEFEWFGIWFGVARVGMVWTIKPSRYNSLSVNELASG